MPVIAPTPFYHETDSPLSCSAYSLHDPDPLNIRHSVYGVCHVFLSPPYRSQRSSA